MDFLVELIQETSTIMEISFFKKARLADEPHDVGSNILDALFYDKKQY